MPQSHRPGIEAEVDFGEAAVRLRGQLATLVLFSLRLSFSGKAVHRTFASGGQQALFEGTFTRFERWAECRGARSAATTGRCPPGARLLPPSGGERTLDRFPLALSIGSFYCQPEVQGAHEKGGVEGRSAGSGATTWSGAEVDSLAELNAVIDAWDAEADRRRVGRPRTVGEMFAVEAPLLRPLPEEPFESSSMLATLMVHLHASDTPATT